MKRGTSLYLDLVRFGAALMVFSEYFKEHTKIGFSRFWAAHPFWYSHSNAYSQTAVTAFFVLSGYVIAHVLATRERAPLDYGASRFARLYSVALPALLLTAVCNYLIELRYPDAFQVFNSEGTSGVTFSYLGSAVFVNRFWLWSNLEPPNIPYWTLSFEAFYCVMIAILVFKGWGRLFEFFLLILVAGPTMALLALTWLLGYLCYHASRYWRVGPGWTVSLGFASVMLLPYCSSLEF
jgi:peptidoglycan/LPS O-acetylase OafA/YrhL